MNFPHFVWVTANTALNLDLVTIVTVTQDSVCLWDKEDREGPLCTLTGDDARDFLAWFNVRVTSTRA